jgi:alcohol dehydrogenase (cytochrome c)
MRSLILLLLVAAAAAAEPVGDKQLLEAQSEAGSWLSYGRNYSGWRHSPLDQINAQNVGRLVPKWMFQMGAAGRNQGTALVHDGMMFLTGPSNTAFALDIKTGAEIWRYAKKVPAAAQGCCAQPNRGFALRGDKLYKVNFEGTLVALDAKTGREIWETTIDDYSKGYSATNAPLVVKNLIVTGIAGAEFGTRDFIDAYDADSGVRVWRFWTIPAPDEPGGDTWNGDAWKRGGGSTWVTGTYDPELNLIYWGTGNPGPDMDGAARPGDNLYTCSIVALDADSGELRWYFQFTPHDVHDWDAVADPVLIDLELEGKSVKAVVQANRNGFFYALDRSTGKFLAARAYTKVTWADGIGSDGRPILIPGKDPTEDGNIACPGLGGGHNWRATAYNPQTGLYYTPTTDGCHIYYKSRQRYIEGQWYQGSMFTQVPKEPTTGAIVALDPANGATKWRFPLVTSPSAGLLSTGGGLIFSGDSQGYVFALDARSGKALWKFQAGAGVRAPPISYEFAGKQYVAVGAGASLVVFGLPQ